MKNILKIGSAFIGAILGAGFTSGQEIMQYFTSFGEMGIVSSIVFAVLFGITGMLMVGIGYKLKAVSHFKVIRQISGRYLGLGYDIVITFTLFGLGVMMFAGAGSIFNQQFGLPTYVGTAIMLIVVLITIMTKVSKVIRILAIVTPFLLAVILFVNIYSLITNNNSFASMEAIASNQHSVTNNWFVASLNYLSLVTLQGAAILFIMGGNEKNGKQASAGGFLGGFLCGILVLVSNFAILMNIENVATLQMPTLGLATEISPYLGWIFSITLFGMIYGTAVSLFFSFSSRFFEPKTKRFNIFSIITLIIACGLSFYGFSNIVSVFLPIIGTLGYVFIIILVIAGFRMKSKKTTEKVNIKLAK